MKKFTYILMFLLGFFVFSCEKQVIVPNDNSHSPTMRSCRGGGQILNGDDSNGGSVNNSITDCLVIITLYETGTTSTLRSKDTQRIS